jgi:hypothetical protein
VDGSKIENLDVMLNGVHAAEVYARHFIQFTTAILWDDSYAREHWVALISGWPLSALCLRLIARCIGDCVVALYHAVFGNALPVVRNNGSVDALDISHIE